MCRKRLSHFHCCQEVIGTVYYGHITKFWYGDILAEHGSSGQNGVLVISPSLKTTTKLYLVSYNKGMNKTSARKQSSTKKVKMQANWQALEISL